MRGLDSTARDTHFLLGMLSSKALIPIMRCLRVPILFGSDATVHVA